MPLFLALLQTPLDVGYSVTELGLAGTVAFGFAMFVWAVLTERLVPGAAARRDRERVEKLDALLDQVMPILDKILDKAERAEIREQLRRERE